MFLYLCTKLVIMGNKKGQNVIVLTMKDTGQTYLFGSLSAIYGMFDQNKLGITSSSLRNAVATYKKEHHIEEEKKAFSQVIYDTPRSPITLHRAPLWLLERAKDVE